MNLTNFKNFIDKTILNRGYDYYLEGNVLESHELGDNEYRFYVQGSDDYGVVVKIDENGEILDSYCDCPYDFGPICKHQVAAYYELLERMNDMDDRERGKATRQPEIQEVLQQLSKEDLIQIIVDITEKDLTLEKRLIVRYAKGDEKQEIQASKTLLRSIVRKHKGREGFITYRQAYAFVSEMDALLEKVNRIEDPLVALDLACIVLNEAIGAFQYADDSGGDIGMFVNDTIEQIRVTALSSEDEKVREKIFFKLLKQCDNSVFDGWGNFKIELLKICAEFADIKALRLILKTKIESMVTSARDDYTKYTNEDMLLILFDMLTEYGTEEEAEQFIKDNLAFTSFREILIDTYRKEKNYQNVIELALEGEKQDKQYAGLVLKWKQIRYEAYRELSLTDEQKKLAKDLLFNGYFAYYNELKELERDKEDFYNHLKKELKQGKDWHEKTIFRKLIVEEKDLEEIMEVVRENPRDIEEYAAMLVGTFPDEVAEIYKQYIKVAASTSSNRSAYKGVCRILKQYKKITDTNHLEEVINELRVLYIRRPAFIDELSKVK